jgi:hypothetical protein
MQSKWLESKNEGILERREITRKSPETNLKIHAL